MYLEEKTVSKGNYYYEIFNLLNDFINTSIKSTENILNQEDVFQDSNGYYKLTSESLDRVIEYCKANPSLRGYDKIYKELFGVKKDDLTGYRIKKDGTPDFATLNVYRSIKQKFQKAQYSVEWMENIDQYNEVVRIFALVPGIVEAKSLIHSSNIISYQFNDLEYEILSSVLTKNKEYGRFCEKLLVRAIADMKGSCLNYQSVSKKFDYEKDAREKLIKKYKRSEEGMLLMDDSFVEEIISSPQVKKSLRQAIKVINQIILEKEEYPAVIAVESTKDMNGQDRKRELEAIQKQNEERRNAARKNFNHSFWGRKSNE